jgi:hypothetical protein
MNRRRFLQSTAAIGGLALSGALRPEFGVGGQQADRVRVAIIGVAGRGADNETPRRR